MSMLNDLKSKKKKLAVVGLGYVGLPLAVAFDKHFDVIGFDMNAEKIDAYKSGIDPTEEAGDEAVRGCNIGFTTDASRLKDAAFIVVSVPTPVNGDKTPDLLPLEKASVTVGENLSPGTIVVYESTVFPGVTEEFCGPILEKTSGMKVGEDFFIGYSPERINPGDPVHRLHNIVKIVSGMNHRVLEEIAEVYEQIIEAGVHRAGSIKVAEAAKVAENSQRDINIAFMNELAMAFDSMGISTHDVVKAMNTKWNALGFQPGLVGGHCIGVDPYYFIYQAEKQGYHSQIIAAGRRINDGMSEFVAMAIMKKMIQEKIHVGRSRIALLGMTFKEDCIDTRNSRSLDVYHLLKEYKLDPILVDPVAEPDDFYRDYGVKLEPMEKLHDCDCLVFLVAHKQFRELGLEKIMSFMREGVPGLIVDVKSIFSKSVIESQGLVYWSL